MNTRKAKAGLLPLYLQLYDEALPEVRAAFTPFIAEVVNGLTQAGADVIQADTCRTAPEVRDALAGLEEQDADLIVTLHLAYSPSLESVDALAHCDRPLLMLDTTMDADFGQGTELDRMMYNHGIHGVQDLASMLRRRGKGYRVAAGHYSESDVLLRAGLHAKAAQAARSFRSMRALRIGESFKGMGDFAVDERTLAERLGIAVDEITPADLAAAGRDVTPDEIAAEMRDHAGRFEMDAPEEAHERSVRAGLALRRYLEQGGYGAFSMNFLAFDSPEPPINAVPFLEACLAMERGLGYAGEGDALTASLVGALNAAFGQTTFTEIFCPDWRGGALFLSHMGEINPAILGGKPLLCAKDFPWTPALPPATLAGAPARGEAVFVNIAPGPQDRFDLIAAPVDVLGDATHPSMREAIRGWIRPRLPVARFLERYSELGGTHHAALVCGVPLEAIAAFADYAGLPLHTLEGD